MYKSLDSGAWEHDFRVADIPRYHMSYGAIRKADADKLHAVAVALFRAREYAVIQALRAGRLTIEQIAQAHALGRPFASLLALAPAAHPWPTLGDAVTQYVDAVRANPNRADGTARAAATQLAKALAFLGADIRLSAITTEMVTAYQSALVAERRATNTVTAYVWRIGALYRWMIRREAIAAREGHRPARVLYVPIDSEVIGAEKTQRTRYLSEVEAVRLLTVTPKRLLFPVACGLFAGLRGNEMAHLRTGFDVDLALGTLAVQVQPGWRPKTKRSVRHVPIAGALRPILEAHLSAFANDEWLSPSFDDPTLPLNWHTFDGHFTRIVKDAELVHGRKDPAGVTFHTLRHTFASWLLMKGADLFTVAQLLGNTVAQVEKTYGHLSKDHRLAAVNRLSEAFVMPVLD